MPEKPNEPAGVRPGGDAGGDDLSQVFHRLNNQLGIVLANAELLEARLADEALQGRASQVVTGALEAISAVRDLRRLVSADPPFGR